MEEKNKYPKGTIGWLREKLCKKCINTDNLSFGDLIRLGQENGILKRWTDVLRKSRENIAKAHGFESIKEYNDNLAQKNGFKDMNEYKKKWSYDKGIRGKRYMNEDSEQYFGCVMGEERIADPILTEIFGEILEKLPYNNPGYDRIVKGGHKIEIKTAFVIDNCFKYFIDYNRIANYFLLLALDNREDKNILHIWLFKRNDKVRERIFYQFQCFKIQNLPSCIEEFGKYDLVGKLKCLKDVQERLNDSNYYSNKGI